MITLHIKCKAAGVFFFFSSALLGVFTVRGMKGDFWELLLNMISRFHSWFAVMRVRAAVISVLWLSAWSQPVPPLTWMSLSSPPNALESFPRAPVHFLRAEFMLCAEQSFHQCGTVKGFETLHQLRCPSVNPFICVQVCAQVCVQRCW